MELQKRLVNLRKERGLSQEELAEKLYVSRQTISNWERGATYPDINSLLLIATFFDVSLDNLVKGDIPIMKQTLEQKQFKKSLILLILSFFAFSVAYPTRFLLSTRLFSILILLIGMRVLRALFNVLYTIKNRQLNTYADIVNFLEGKDKQVTSRRSDLGFVFILLIGAWLIFFIGTVLSTLIFF